MAFRALGTEPTREVVGGAHDSLEEALGSRPVVLDDREVGSTRISVMPYAQACEPTFAYSGLIGLASLSQDSAGEAPPCVELPRYNRRGDEQ